MLRQTLAAAMPVELTHHRLSGSVWQQFRSGTALALPGARLCSIYRNVARGEAWLAGTPGQVDDTGKRRW
jgi:hypothetical protein